MNIIKGNETTKGFDLIRINRVFDKARFDHSEEKIEQERSWIQHLVDTHDEPESIFIEAGVVFGYMEVLEKI